MSESGIRIGDWVAHPSANELVHDSGRRIRLEQRAMKVLELLHARQGRVVSSQEILDEVWEGAAVSGHSVAIVVSALRKALGDDKSAPRYIETVPKRGYRLIALLELPVETRARATGWKIGAVLGSLAMLAIAGAAVALRASSGRPLDLDLQDEYFQARQLWSRRDDESVRTALQLLGRILEEREDFAPAHLALADIYAHKTGEHLGLPALDTFREAQRHLDRARELDPDRPEVWVTQALLDFYRDAQPEKALASVDAALELDPDSSLAWQTRAMATSALGGHAESLEAIAKARELDPLSDSIGWDEVWFLYLAGEPRRALEALSRASRYSRWNYLYGALIQQDLGDARGALESWIERFAQKGAPLPSPEKVRALAERSDLPAAYRELLRQFETLEGYREYAGVVAIWNVLAGRSEAALAILEAIPPDRENWMGVWVREMPIFEPLLGRIGGAHHHDVARR